jgi:hypothetical protein
VRSEVPTAVKMLMMIWVVMPCGLIGGFQHFGGDILCTALMMEAVCFSETLVST